MCISKASRYNKKLTYKPTDTNYQKHSKHNRKIKWFNPMFSKKFSKKIGKSTFMIAYSTEINSK